MYYCRYKLYLVRRCIIMTTDLGLTNTKLGFIILPVPNCAEYTLYNTLLYTLYTVHSQQYTSYTIH